jgi:hypothetical protein
MALDRILHGGKAPRRLAEALTAHGHRQSGQTPVEWLEMMFEFELCEHCGRDEPDHDVRIDVLGLLHTHCLKEPLT